MEEFQLNTHCANFNSATFYNKHYSSISIINITCDQIHFIYVQTIQLNGSSEEVTMYSFIKEGDASNFYLPASNIFLTIVCELSVEYELKNLTKAHFSHTFCSPSAWIEDLLTTLTTKSESIKQELN